MDNSSWVSWVVSFQKLICVAKIQISSLRSLSLNFLRDFQSLWAYLWNCPTFWIENLFGMDCITREKIFMQRIRRRCWWHTGCSELYRTAHRCSNANPIFRLRFFSINWKCESTTQGDTDEKCESLEPTNWEIRDIANIYIKSEHISQTAWKDLWGNGTAFGWGFSLMNLRFKFNSPFGKRATRIPVKWCMAQVA